jgi:hypothetical protein
MSFVASAKGWAPGPLRRAHLVLGREEPVEDSADSG